MQFGHVTLHVGAGTFQPVRVADIARHRMHSEWLNVGPELVEQVRRTRAAGGRVIAVGHTVVRALASAPRDGGLPALARTGVVWGTSVAVRVAPGGTRDLKNTTH